MLEWIPIRIPKELYQEVTEVIDHTKFWVNEHEFIRDAVREKLANTKIPCEVSTKEV